MEQQQFVHLHNHTEYSMLDGAARVDDLFTEAARMGMPALAVTDHGTLFGVHEFWRTGKRHGVKPIIGCELYATPGTSRFDKTRVRWGEDPSADDVSGSGAYTHLTIWAETTAGMHNLFRLASLASLEGQHRKPRVDRELLSRYAPGLIATTGCPGGEVNTRLRLRQYGAALEAAGEFRDIFGPENYFVELMDHGLDVEHGVRADLLRLAGDLNLPLVATNDLHYVREEDAHPHEALLAVQSGSTLADPDRFHFEGKEFYLKSAEAMRHLFRELPEACDNTLLIAERCSAEFTEQAGRFMPAFPVPDGESEESWFAAEVERGLARRYPRGVPATVRAQADYELTVIQAKGYAGYFLVVADFVNWSRDHGIRVGPGRGSGAGSVAAYALGITGLDPLAHGLIFERFLNPERASMPDFDIDLDDRRRHEVVQYVTRKYGDDRVAGIVTYGTIKSRQALKDAARVLGHPWAVGDALSKAMPPPVMGQDVPLPALFDAGHPRFGEGKPFRELLARDEIAREVVATARGLEGLKRQWGVHAAGVVLSSAPLLEVLPIMRREADGAPVTQLDMGACEDLGLVKMDFLGLKTLSVLTDALSHLPGLVLEDLPLDDPATYDLLGRGDTLGVFQFDGDSMRSLLRMIKPDNFEDISAVGALNRPGPMGAGSHIAYAMRKNGLQPVTYPHTGLAAALEPILRDTYGLIIYQEQVMQIAQELAGYSLGQADILRKAIGKKKREVLDKEFPGFEAGMKARGFRGDAIQALWDVLVPFSDYAFNKAHSCAYGMVSYWTAYLKANHPAEYMAAVLTGAGDQEKHALYLRECRRMGLTVSVPDVSLSGTGFTPDGHGVRFGLAGIRNAGAAAVAGIVAARPLAGGVFTSLEDFLARVPAASRNKRVVESLIQAGAFDSLGHSRRGLFQALEVATAGTSRTAPAGVHALFGEPEPVSTAPAGHGVAEWDQREMLAREREMLGVYVSGHPLDGSARALARVADCDIAVLTGDDGRPDGATVTLTGLLGGVSRRVAKQSGKLWASATLEDATGDVRVLAFPQVYDRLGPMLTDGSTVAVRGRVSRREGVVELFAEDLWVPDLSEPQDGPLTVRMPVSRCTPALVRALGAVLAGHHGPVPVRLELVRPGQVTLMELPATAMPSAALFSDLRSLLGPSALPSWRGGLRTPASVDRVPVSAK